MPLRNSFEYEPDPDFDEACAAAEVRYPWLTDALSDFIWDLQQHHRTGTLPGALLPGSNAVRVYNLVDPSGASPTFTIWYAVIPRGHRLPLLFPFLLEEV